MATRWRLHFDGDNIYTEKKARIHKLTEDVEWRIDNIPGVVNDLNSDSETDALSAKMGKVLYDEVKEALGVWHFLSTWDAVTGTPSSEPVDDPYEYHTWDYYIVSNVGSTNYKPHWGTYTHWQVSTAVETWTVWVNDWYLFDGRTWVRQPAWDRAISIDASLSSTSTNAVENRVVTNALNQKQWIISDLAAIRNWAAAGSTALQRLANISELTNNLWYQTAWDVAVAISWKANTSDVTALAWRVAAAEGKISTLETSSADYASRISSLETSSWGASQDIADLQGDVTSIQWDITSIEGDITSIEGDISSLQGSVSSLQGAVNGHTISISNLQGDVSSLQTTVAWKADVSDVNTKTFYLSDTSDLTTAQEVMNWLLAWKNPIVKYSGYSYLCVAFDSQTSLFLVSPYYDIAIENNSVSKIKAEEIYFSLNSNNEVTAITAEDYRVGRCLSTDINYPTPYTPQYPWSPATKKYVDDIVWDIESLLANI